MFGRRTLEIGVVLVIMVMVFSMSCVMGAMCAPKESSSSSKGQVALDNSIQVDSDKIDEKNVKKKMFNLTTTTESSATTKSPKKITVWSANNHVGRQRTVTFEDEMSCQNLPELVQNKVQSVNTYDDCFVLCDKLDCKGWCVKFEPGSPSHNRLRKIRFHNRAESVATCEGFLATQ